MEKQPNKLTAKVGEDRISRLPDQILHCIIRRLDHSKEAGQTITLSKQWRRVWHSYPVVHFDLYSRNSRSDLEKFSDSTIARFSRDSLLGMETLKLQPIVYEQGAISCPAVEQLLDLALERKAQEIEVIVSSFYYCLGLRLPYRVLFNSTVKTLRLSKVVVDIDDDFHANSPLLETLQLIGCFGDMSFPVEEEIEIVAPPFQVLQVTNLKKLHLESCSPVEEIEMVAPQLQSLYLQQKDLLRIELTAPLLQDLEINATCLTNTDVQDMISKLPSLKYLTLHQHFFNDEKKLKLSSPSLVEFKLYPSLLVEEIELDAGPDLEKVFIHYDRWLDCHHDLQKCRISNAGPSCRLEVCYIFRSGSKSRDSIQEWFNGFKNFLRCNHFHTVIIKNMNDNDIGFLEHKLDTEEVDRDISRGTIEHLKCYFTSSSCNQAAALEIFFWACRPKVLTIFSDSMRDWHDFFSLKELHGRFNWRRELKDVNMEQGEEQTNFWLTWYDFDIS
ncbi:hypothetical protein LINGRAHAP2_LOCUS28560 [Linum grandiflorum]